MEQYIIVQAQINLDFRKSELSAISTKLNLDADFGLYTNDSPFWIAYIKDDRQAKALAQESVTIKSIFKYWAQGSILDELIVNLRLRVDELSIFRKNSFKFSFDVFQEKCSLDQQKAIIELFSFLPFDGPVKLSKPQVEFGILMQYNCNKSLQRCYFGHLIAHGSRDMIQKFDLKKRKYLGITSFDSELSLITAQMALAMPGKMIYDPFVGTGSFLYTCAAFGAHILGSDLDGRQIRGNKTASIKSNISQYGLESKYIDVWTCDIRKTSLRTNLKFDAIVCDPPYGVRAGAKKQSHIKSSNINATIQTCADSIEDMMSFKQFSCMQPYDVTQIILDLFDLGYKKLVKGGRLVFWMPIFSETLISDSIPSHPAFELISTSVQQFNHWQRILLVFERNSEQMIESKDIIIDHINLTDFRSRYFNKVSYNTDLPKENVYYFKNEVETMKKFNTAVSLMYKFQHQDIIIGYTPLRVVELLREEKFVFCIDDKAKIVRFSDNITTFDQRSESLKVLLEKWRSKGNVEILNHWKNELNSVFLNVREEYMRLERCALPLFGFVSYASHLIAYNKIKRAYKIWVQRRSYRKDSYPGMLDNTVGGGIRSQQSPKESIIRASFEEAYLDPGIVSNSASSFGTASSITKSNYLINKRKTCHLESIHINCYELELDVGTVPKPNDGEAAEFILKDPNEILQDILEQKVKPESKVVFLNFFIRHGLLNVDIEPNMPNIELMVHFQIPLPLGGSCYVDANKNSSRIGLESLNIRSSEVNYDLNLLHSKDLQSKENFGIIVLNQAITLDHSIFYCLWQNSNINICCDGAADKLIKYDKKLVPDYIVGDLDSITKQAIEFFSKKGVKIIKDKCQYSTDLFKALHVHSTQQSGKPLFIVHKSFGGRFDQTLAVLHQAFQMVDTSNSQKLVLIDENSLVVFCKGRSTTRITFKNTPSFKYGPHCGLCPLNGPARVNTKGFYWELENTEIKHIGIISTCNLLKPSKYEEKSVEIQVFTNEAIMFILEFSVQASGN